MNIDDLTLGQIKEIQNMCADKNQYVSSEDSHWEIGKNYFIRTVTMIQVGELIKVTEREIVLKKAAWVVDTGRFSNALVNNDFDEVEMFPKENEVIIGRGAIVDATIYNRDLPTETK